MLPGFTAEASLGPTVQKYRLTHLSRIGAAEYLSPQQFDDVGEGDFGELDDGGDFDAMDEDDMEEGFD